MWPQLLLPNSLHYFQCKAVDRKKENFQEKIKNFTLFLYSCLKHPSSLSYAVLYTSIWLIKMFTHWKCLLNSVCFEECFEKRRFWWKTQILITKRMPYTTEPQTALKIDLACISSAFIPRSANREERTIAQFPETQTIMSTLLGVKSTNR